ncbi:MAG: class I SAM-dependent methyltransferase [Arenicellales bacterium]|jgi:SAM-dependent methyltransferase
MNEIIGAQHEFHDKEFVTGWADRFVPTPERLQLFKVILAELKCHVPSDSCIVELGIGPGYLADHLLRAMPGIRYFGVDFSAPMLDIARQRLGQHSKRVTYVQADLVKDRWWRDIPVPVNAIVSTWALHDLGSQENVETVYRNCSQTLINNGLLLNGDFIKPDNAVYEYEPGRFEITRHIEMLQQVGFKTAKCLLVLEKEIKSPTAAQNYACFKAVAEKML